MRRVVICKVAILLVLSSVAGSMSGSDATAGDHHDHYWVSRDPTIGYAVAIQHVYQHPAAFVFQPTTPWGYTVPIQHVYQFPAAFVFQPGRGIPYGTTAGAIYDQYGGPSFIPR